MIRWLTAAILGGLLVAGVLYDRVEQDPNMPDPVVEMVITSPEVEFPPALATTWFCPVGSSSADGYATNTVIISNLGEEEAVANLDVRTEDGPGASLRIDLAAGATETVNLDSLGSHAAAAAVIEVIGGQGVVSHRVVTGAGLTEGPCATSSSSDWYLAGGSTTRDASQYIALLNPFPNDVVFTATFQTSTRTREPGDLDRAVVAGHSVRVINVADYVARERVVATAISTGERGQLVVERLQTFDGSLGPVGAAMELAVPSAALEWRMPAGRIHEDGDNTVTVFNPTDQVAEVDVQLDPLLASDRASFGLVPVPLTIQPGRISSLDLRLIADQVGLPLPYDVGVTVSSANGVPVVVDRWQLNPAIDTALIGAGGTSGRRSPLATGGPFARQNDGEVPDDGSQNPETEFTFVQPTARSGSATSRGTSLLSTRWVTGFVSLFPDNGTAVIVTAPEGALVEVRQMLGGVLGSPVRSSIEEQGRSVIALGNPVDGAPIIVTSDRPIAVEIQIVTPDRFDVVPVVPTVSTAPTGDGS